MNLTEGNNTLNISLVPVTVTPQMATLAGTVTDANTGLPLPGVRVMLDNISTTTDAHGAYAFVNLTPGNYILTFSKSGYETDYR